MKQRPHLHLSPLPEQGSTAQSSNRLIASLLTLALLLTLIAIACSGPNAKIAFISDRDGDAEIYVMSADGSDVTRLTDTGGHISSYPKWSPDGQRIAFSSSQSGNGEIYVMNADGSGLTQLTHSDRDDSNPVWSPDGQRIAFVSNRPGALVLPGALAKMNADSSGLAQLAADIFDIYLVNADGSGLTQLTDDAGRDFFPSWSPDGQCVVFMSDRDGDPDIYLVNADGSGLTQLTHNGELEFFPNWSPDGQRILFYTWPTGGNPELYMMNSDGSDRTRMTHNIEMDSYHSFPVMSPDRRRVERVVSFADPNGDDDYEIYIMNPDGSDLTQLTVADTYRGARDEEPIVFSTTTYDADGDDEIYIVNCDGSGLVRLTNNTSRDFAPHLAPTP